MKWNHLFRSVLKYDSAPRPNKLFISLKSNSCLQFRNFIEIWYLFQIKDDESVTLKATPKFCSLNMKPTSIAILNWTENNFFCAYFWSSLHWWFYSTLFGCCLSLNKISCESIVCLCVLTLNIELTLILPFICFTIDTWKYKWIIVSVLSL